MSELVDISVVIPAYCEEQRLGPTLSRMREYLTQRGGTAEIIVVDDGSADHTSGVARESLAGYPRHEVLRNEPNAGKGASVRRGMLAAAGEVVLFSDADLSTPIEEMEKLLAAHAEGAHIAVGSRALRESRIEVHQSRLRETMGRCFNLFIRAFVLGGIRDTQCGFKSFKRETIVPIFRRQTIERWGFDVEILYIARRLGYTVAEVPVVWRNDEATKVNAGADGLKMLREALQARRLHRGLTPNDRENN
ncbi:MAG: glycosyltransferase family 2 protein [Armatimonadetes bacterium]|nr:glycosyltransferase family 2 protein [Armatimonadota bacterium]